MDGIREVGADEEESRPEHTIVVERIEPVILACRIHRDLASFGPYTHFGRLTYRFTENNGLRIWTGSTAYLAIFMPTSDHLEIYRELYMPDRNGKQVLKRQAARFRMFEKVEKTIFVNARRMIRDAFSLTPDEPMNTVHRESLAYLTSRLSAIIPSIRIPRVAGKYKKETVQ